MSKKRIIPWCNDCESSQTIIMSDPHYCEKCNSTKVCLKQIEEEVE